MELKISLRDGQNGGTGGEAQGCVFIGAASFGPLNTLVGVGDGNIGREAFKYGDLPDRLSFHFSADGKGPTYGLRCATSTAGAIPEYKVQVHAAYAGNNPANLFPGPLAQPATPHNLEVAAAAGYDGGALAVVGIGTDDGAITETITPSAGSTVKGLRVYKSITSITKAAVGANPATVTVYTGNKTAEGASTTNGKLTLSGTPLASYDVRAQITRAGDVAAGVPAAIYSWDGGLTWSSEIAIPAGGVYAGFVTDHGITFTYVGTLMKIGDTFGQKVTGPTPTSGDVSAALDALAADPRTWEFLHVLSPASAAQAAMVESWFGTQRTAGRWAFGLGEIRDIADTETDATWQTSVLTDYAGMVSTYGQYSAVAGHGLTIIPDRGIQRRSLGWTTATQISRIPISVHPGSPAEAGMLRGLYNADKGGLFHDERLHPGLGGSIGRFMTVQTLVGFPGAYVSDAGGHRSGGTMATGNSDYARITAVRIIMKACRILQSKGPLLLLVALATKSDKTLLESVAGKLDEKCTGWLDIGMKGDVVSVRAITNRTEPVYDTRDLKFDIYIRPFIHNEIVEFSVGFED